MQDQADRLRSLALQAKRIGNSQAAVQPRMFAISGGKGGVGASTISVNLAVALAQQGKRVVLADVNVDRADVTLMCGLKPRGTIADVFAGRASVHEILENGPAGIQVLPGLWNSEVALEVTPASQQRLLDQFSALGRFADIVLLDTGRGNNEALQRYWQACEQLILVTTTDTVAIMDTYATIKLHASACQLPLIRVLVNQVTDPALADHVHDRLNISCQRFLGISILDTVHVPVYPHAMGATDLGVPLMVQSPTSEVARAVDRVAVQLAMTSTPPAAAAA
jgi:flagellar biosynthesis protein FlhG